MAITYLNQAGTSWPKPVAVTRAAAEVLTQSPPEWDALYSQSLKDVAEFFHVDQERLVLTPSCTAALSLATSDHDWAVGERIVTSHFEHHALDRNLQQLAKRGIDVTVIRPAGDDLFDRVELEAELNRSPVRLVAITGACNVTGRLLPIADIVAISHRFGAKVLVDGAQIAGWWDLDVAALGCDLFTFAGHKAPHGPWGIGGLYVAPDMRMDTPVASCDVTESLDVACQLMPGYCDAGSINMSALAGLAVACRWLGEDALSDRLSVARQLASEFADGVRSLPGIKLHHVGEQQERLPTVAVTLDGILPSSAAAALRQRDVVASGGFQCSPQAHLALGTAESGALRFSFGVGNKPEDPRLAIEALHDVVRSL